MRVLLLATTTGYQTRAFGDAADRMGAELVFATDRCDRLDDPWQDKAIPIRFHRERDSVARIVRAAAAQPIDGVLAVGDRPTVIAAKAMQALGLNGHPPEAAAVARDKRRTRARLRAAGLPVPSYVAVPVGSDPATLARSVLYPCVVKPAALSASRGVMRADSAGEFVDVFDRLRAILRAPDVLMERNTAHQVAIVEAFIEGREYAVEALMHHGRLKVLAIFDKPDPLDGPFFEETIYVTPSSASEEVQDAIVDTIGRAARAIGLYHGPIHAECRVNSRGVFVLEVAARPIGGLCARALRFESSPAHGNEPIPLEELLLRHAVGESPEPWTREPVASGVMMIPIPRRGVFRGVDGVDVARAVRGIDDVRITAKPDQLLVPLPEGASYLGFIFARGSSTSQVDTALREAHAQLRFAIDSELRVVTAP